MGPKGSLMHMPFIFYLHKFWRTFESEAMFRFTKKILFEEEILEILETQKITFLLWNTGVTSLKIKKNGISKGLHYAGVNNYIFELFSGVRCFLGVYSKALGVYLNRGFYEPWWVCCKFIIPILCAAFRGVVVRGAGVSLEPHHCQCLVVALARMMLGQRLSSLCSATSIWIQLFRPCWPLPSPSSTCLTCLLPSLLVALCMWGSREWLWWSKSRLLRWWEICYVLLSPRPAVLQCEGVVRRW